MEIFAEILYYPIGWLYLWLKHRNKAKVKKALNEQYDGDYHIAGAQLIWRAFGIVLLTVLIILLLAVIGRTIYN